MMLSAQERNGQDPIIRVVQPAATLDCPLSAHLVAKLDHTVPAGFDFGEVERDVPVEPVEEADPITDQNRQNRVTHLIGKPETQAFRGNDAASGEPDGTKPGPQMFVDELCEIA
jgi:hypothetical protein